MQQRSRSPSLAMDVDDTGKTTEDGMEMKSKKTGIMGYDTPPRVRIVSRQNSEGGIAVSKIPSSEETPKREDVQQVQMEGEGGEKRSIDDVVQVSVRAYVDSLEDEIAFDEEFPLENLDSAKERFERMDTLLSSASDCAQKHAMTMEMNESEQTGERIEHLKSDIAHRRQRAIDHRPEWEAFLKIMSEASSDVAALENEQTRNEEGASEEMFEKTEKSVCETVRQLAGILPRMVEGGERAGGLRKEIASLEDRFRSVGYSLRETRAKKAAQEVDEAAVCRALEELINWVSSAALDAVPPTPPTNSLGAEAARSQLQTVLARIGQMKERKASLGRLESDQDRLVSLDRGDNKTKHAIRRGVSETAKQMSDLRLSLNDRRATLERQAEEAEEFWKMVDDTGRLAAETIRDAEAVCAATVYTPSPAKTIIEQLREREREVIGIADSHGEQTVKQRIRIRRALLEASLRSRSDLHTALGEVEEWLDKTQNRVEQLSVAAIDPHLLKDSGKRKDTREKLEELDREVESHADVVNDVTEMSAKVLEQLERGKERDGLQQRMNSLSNAWEATKARCGAIRKQVEKAESEWEGLRRKLAELLAWTDQQSRDLVNNAVMAGNLSSALHQVTASKTLAKQLEMKVAVQEANAYLMQHDLRRKMAGGGVLEGEDEIDERDPISAEEQRCGLQLAADVERLKVGWARLQQQHTEWSAVVTAGAARLQSLERALAECQLGLTGLEAELETATPVENLRLEQLGQARKDSDFLTEKVNELRGQMDEANAASAAVSAADQLEAVNKRYDSLRASTRVRVAAISNALKNLGPSSEHFLAQSVQLPWQRAVSATNRLPYYIDHKTERTQWDHPAWVELSRELATFNRVKFIAYRTAMKLRALQKRLWLDLISLDDLDKGFGRLDLSSEESISLESMVTCLVPVYEQLHLQQPHVIRSLSLAIDLVVNLTAF